MAKLFAGLKKLFRIEADDDPELMGDDDYVHIDSHAEAHADAKLLVRPYNLEEFTDVKEILEGQRAGNIIALINIRPLKEKDMIEVKRAINKLKKSCEATGGSIAGFGENWIVVSPSGIEIMRQRAPEAAAPAESKTRTEE